MTPRSPKSPARKKARVWKAWAVVAGDNGELLWCEVDDEYGGTLGAVYETEEDAMADANDGERVVRVTIREVPAPVPPRSRKGGSR